jgi:folate-binding Fe-S cluster repair protein YgfZ
LLCRQDSFLLATERETLQKLLEHLDRFIIADDVTPEDLSSCGFQKSEMPQWKFQMTRNPVDILEMVGIEIPCRNCAGQYGVSLEKIALSQEARGVNGEVKRSRSCTPHKPDARLESSRLEEMMAPL